VELRLQQQLHLAVFPALIAVYGLEVSIVVLDTNVSFHGVDQDVNLLQIQGTVHLEEVVAKLTAILNLKIKLELAILAGLHINAVFQNLHTFHQPLQLLQVVKG